MSDLTAALAALADLGVHPVGITVDGQLITLRLAPADQATVLTDHARREQIVSTLKSHGFLYVTLALSEMAASGFEPLTKGL